MSIEWVACYATDGVVITDFPGLDVPSIESVLMGYATATATLPITDDVSEDWPIATNPGAAYLVMLEDGVPTWGGLIATRSRNSSDAVTLSLGTVETYLLRRFVGDVTYADTDQGAIAEALITAYADTFPITVDANASAYTRDRTYTDDADKTVYSILSELSGIINGPEWTVRWTTTTVGGKVAYCPVLVVADRLGSAPLGDLAPATTWDFPGVVTEFEFVEDYTSNNGANDVLAVSTASADVRPQSSHATVVDGRPKYEARFTPSTSITDTATLDAHAQARLAQVQDGTTSLTLALNATATGGRPGIDFQLGDTVGFTIGDDNTPLPAFPGGMCGRARVTGYQRTFEPPIVTPTLTELELD